MGMSIWEFTSWLAGHTPQGWTSVKLLFLLIASFQTFTIAVIGEYFGKIYFETKGPPRYIVEQEIGVAATRHEAIDRGEALQPPTNDYSRAIL
jgi:polyisoprenyl-phosphate glycosyltransferase